MSSSIESLVNREYQYGFVTDVETDTIPPGLSEEVIRLISAKKGEPQWLLDWRPRGGDGTVPPRPGGGVPPPHPAKKGGPAVAARRAAQGLPPLAHDEGAALAQRRVQADRVSGAVVLFRSKVRHSSPVARRR